MAGKSVSQKNTAGKRRKLSPEAMALLPYPEFPLSPHLPSNRWYKVHKGRRYYFGPLENWQAALEKYERDWPQIITGRKPRPNGEAADGSGLTLGAGVNRWLAARVEDGEAGTITASTVRAYYETAARLVAELGASTPISWLGPEDFRKLGATYRGGMAPSQASKSFVITRQVFRWLYENEHIPAPPRFGSDFKMGKRQGRQVRDGDGRQVFTAEQCRALLDAAEQGVKGERWAKGEQRPAGVAPSIQLKAMILLALNGGYTQGELAALRIEDVDLDAALIDHRRHKTNARRTVTLWPETVEALRQVLDTRPEPKPEADGLVFVTRKGLPWVRERLATVPSTKEQDKRDILSKRVDSVGLQFSKLAKGAGVNVAGAGFGHLRHTHRTISDEAGDHNAALRIMGHDVPGISRHYVRDISLDRLRAVTDHVRAWLYPPKKQTKKKTTKKKAATKKSAKAKAGK